MCGEMPRLGCEPRFAGNRLSWCWEVLLAVWRGFEFLQEVSQSNKYSIGVCLAHSNAKGLSPQLYGILATIVYLCKDHTRKVDFSVEILPDNVFGCWEWHNEKSDSVDPVHAWLNLSLSQRLAYDVLEEHFVVLFDNLTHNNLLIRQVGYLYQVFSTLLTELFVALSIKLVHFFLPSNEDDVLQSCS